MKGKERGNRDKLERSMGVEKINRKREPRGRETKGN